MSKLCYGDVESLEPAALIADDGRSAVLRADKAHDGENCIFRAVTHRKNVDNPTYVEEDNY